MRYQSLFNKYLGVIIFWVFSSCSSEIGNPSQIDFSKHIIGKWIQTKSFDLVDASQNPPKYDWFDVENGYTLRLNPDKSFVYTKFGSCKSGTYIFDPEFLKIKFLFDCELNGKPSKMFTVQIDESASDQSSLLLDYFKDNSQGINVFSVLEKIE